MTEARSTLLKGAVKSAVSSATGMILSLNITDPKDFSITTLGGWKHLAIVVAVSIVIAEARFWQQWAHSGNEDQ